MTVMMEVMVVGELPRENREEDSSRRVQVLERERKGRENHNFIQIILN